MLKHNVKIWTLCALLASSRQFFELLVCTRAFCRYWYQLYGNTASTAHIRHLQCDSNAMQCIQNAYQKMWPLTTHCHCVAYKFGKNPQRVFLDALLTNKRLHTDRWKHRHY